MKILDDDAIRTLRRDFGDGAAEAASFDRAISERLVHLDNMLELGGVALAACEAVRAGRAAPDGIRSVAMTFGMTLDELAFCAALSKVAGLGREVARQAAADAAVPAGAPTDRGAA